MNKVLWEYSHTHLSVAVLHQNSSKQLSSHRDCISDKAYSIYCQTLYRKSVPTPVLSPSKKCLPKCEKGIFLKLDEGTEWLKEKKSGNKKTKKGGRAESS